MLGIRTVLNGGWEHDEIFVPPGFLYNAWNLSLPKGSFSVLLSIMCYIFQGYNKKELTELMVKEEKRLSLTPFGFQLPKAASEEEQWLYYQTLTRETGIKKILERSGYSYPQNIEEFIYLLIRFGIVFEVNDQGTIFYDIIIEPFPCPENELTLTDEERNEMDEHRRTYLESR